MILRDNRQTHYGSYVASAQPPIALHWLGDIASDLVLLDTCGDPADARRGLPQHPRRRGGHGCARHDRAVGDLAERARPRCLVPGAGRRRAGAGPGPAARPARPRRGRRCAEVHSVGIQVALTADGAVELSATSPVGPGSGGGRQGRHRATARPGQDLPRRRLPVGVLRHLTQPLAPVVLDGGLREPGQGPFAPASGPRPPRVGTRGQGHRGGAPGPWPGAAGPGGTTAPVSRWRRLPAALAPLRQ